MDGIGTAVVALGALALLAVLVRAAVDAGRAARGRASAVGTHAASLLRALGGRGLVAAAAGTASAASAVTVSSAASASPVPAQGRPVPAPTAGAVVRAHVPATYVVRAGDSLWVIAARQLGPGASDAQIAAEWPRWYRANRAVIGSNPSLLLVGMRLVVPDGRRTGTSASPHRTPAPSGPDRTAQALDPDRR